MKKKILVVLLFSLSLTQPARAGGGGGFSGATEYTQILNNVQLADSYAQQVLQYQNQLLQYDTMLKNLAEHPVGNITPKLNALVSNQARVMSGTQNIGSSMAAVNENFAAKFESPVAGSYAERFNGWTDHSNDALKTAMRNSGLQRENFESDEEAMKALVEKNHASGGNLAAIKTVGEINAAQLQESMKLRDLISRQQDAQNIYLATQVGEARDKRAINKRLSGSVKPLPKRGDPMPGGL